MISLALVVASILPLQLRVDIVYVLDVSGVLFRRILLVASSLPPGYGEMSNFRGASALDLVGLGSFQAPRGGCDRYSGRFDINSH